MRYNIFRSAGLTKQAPVFGIEFSTNSWELAQKALDLLTDGRNWVCIADEESAGNVVYSRAPAVKEF